MKNIFKIAKYAVFAAVLAGSIFQAQAVEKDITSISEYIDTVKAQARFVNDKVNQLTHSAAQALGVNDSTVGILAKNLILYPALIDRYLPGFKNLSLGKQLLTGIALGGIATTAYNVASQAAADLIAKRDVTTRAEALAMAEEAKEMLNDANEILADLKAK